MRHPAPIRLTAPDAERYARLRAHMLEDSPWAFGASPEDDVALRRSELLAYLKDDLKAIFAVESSSAAGDESVDEAPELVAAAGVVRTRRPKSAHRAQIWGVYVHPEHRGRGFGRAVVAAAIEFARESPQIDFVDIGVSENSPEALRLYERLGFVAWGREPHAIQCNGRRFDEIFMTLRLR